VRFQRRLHIAVFALVFLLLAGNLALNLRNTRIHFSEQLQSLAQDAATSLGLSVSAVASDDDYVRAESLVSAMFDSGHYLSIVYIDADGNVVIARARELSHSGAPGWFAAWNQLPTYTGTAEVVSGWYRLGEIRVVPSPAHAYRQSWQALMQQLWLFVAGAVIAYAVFGLLLRSLFAPLRRMERQVNELSEDSLGESLSEPNIYEYKAVVSAFNQLSSRYHKSYQNQLKHIETLRRERSMDKLTGLPNREDFDARVRAWCLSEYGDAPSAMLLFAFPEVATLNDERGRRYTDSLLCAIADRFTQLLSQWPDAIIGRHTGTDFVLFISGIYGAELYSCIDEINKRLEEVTQSADLALKYQVGVAIASTRVNLESLLSAADEALRQAHLRTSPYEIVDLAETTTMAKPARDWLPLIENALNREDIDLHLQPVFWGGENKLDHYEVLCRLRVKGEIVSAGVFWSLAERFGLSMALDKAVLGKALALLERRQDIILSVNLSVKSLRQEAFMRWLEVQLKEQRNGICKRLILEFPENLMWQSQASVDELSKLATQNQCSVSVDRFGLRATSMARIQTLRPRLVKLDARFVAGIAKSGESKIYTQSLLAACDTVQIQLFAEGIEDQADLAELKNIGVAGFKGYLLGRPAAIEEILGDG
jgi:diguanylate cyclase (GGDEF)-like protein